MWATHKLSPAEGTLSGMSAERRGSPLPPLCSQDVELEPLGCNSIVTILVFAVLCVKG